MTDKPKPPPPPPPSAIVGCLVFIVGMGALWFGCGSCAGGERAKQVYIRNEGPAVGLRLVYEHHRGDTEIAHGVLLNSTRFESPDFHSFELPVPDVQAGDTLVISGNRLFMGEWADVPPITVPADDDVHLTYGPDTVTGRVGLRSP